MKTPLFFQRIFFLWVFAFSVSLFGQTYTLDLAVQSSAFGTSNSYGAKSGTVSGVTWYANAASAQSASNVWIGTNNAGNRTSLTVLSSGVNGRGGAIASALGITISDVGYYAIVGANAISNVGSIKVKAPTTGGTAPSTLWCLYTTDGGTSYTVLGSVATPGTTEQTFTPSSTIASAQYAFVFYSTAFGTYRTPYFKFYGPTCTTSVFSFASPTVNKTTADAPFTNTFTTDNTSPTSYSSTNTSVATVDANSGEITIVGPGNSTISVTQVDDGTHCAVSANYDLTITSTAPQLDITGTQDHGSICVNASAPTVTYTVTNSGAAMADGILVSSSDSQFAVSNLSSTSIAANGGTATFDLVFTPTSSGLQTADINVTSTTPNSNSTPFAVNGTGNTSVSGLVSTNAASTLNNASATLNANITTLGTCPATTEKGFVWGTNASPTIADNSVSVAGLATGTYTYSVTGLTPNTTYHYQAYIKDANNGYTYGGDQSFTTLSVADHLAFVSVPSNGNINTNLASFTVEARRTDNSVDASYAGNVTLSKASGPGTITGTLSQAFVNGVATFSDIKLDAVGAYSLHADHGAFAQITSSTIDIISAPTYAKINSLAELTDGEYLIGDANGAVIMTNTITSGAVVTTNSNASNNQILNPAATTVWNIIKTGGTYTIQNVSNSNYLNYVGSTNLSIVSAVTTNNQRWNISYNTDHFSVVNVADNTRLLKYNAALSTPGFKAYTGVTQSPEVSLYKKVITTTWDGNTWSNGNPDPSTPVIINDDYSGPSFVSAGLTINPTKILTITNGITITTGDVTDNGSIIVEDGGNFIQTPSGLYSGSGTFTVNRSSASLANKYAFWSSPVAATNVYDLFPGFTPQYVMTYNTATDYYTVLPNPSSTIAGTGYSIKIPTSAPNLTFLGDPNNGSFNKTLILAGDNFNLVGNPYPSNLNLHDLYTANTANIGSTFWFWDNTSNSVTTQSGNTTTNVGYATYNADTETWTAAPTSTSPSGTAAKIGQGFIVEAISTTLEFDNTMRVSDTGVSLNKSVNSNEGKYWLKLTTPYNTNVTQAVTYTNSASDALDVADSKALALGSDAFYSLVGNEKLIIQGRAAFDIDDAVILGNKHFENGTFTIELSNTEGLFNTGQAIYLRDKLLGTETNLQNTPYSFSSSAGEYTNRFEIVYKQIFLGTQTALKEDLKIYRSGNDFIVESPSRILTVEVYDASGRLLQSLKSNTKKEVIRNLSKGVYILQITTNEGITSRKILK